MKKARESPLDVLRMLRRVVDEDPRKISTAAQYRVREGRSYIPVCIWGHVIERLYGHRALLLVPENTGIDQVLVKKFGLKGSLSAPCFDPRFSEELRTFLNFCSTVQEAQDNGQTWETAFVTGLTAFYGGSYKEAAKQLCRKGVLVVQPQGQDEGSAGTSDQGVRADVDGGQARDEEAGEPQPEEG